MSASAYFHDIPHSISLSIVRNQYSTVRKCCNSLNARGKSCGEVCSSKLEKPLPNRHSHCSVVYKNLSTMPPRANLLRQKHSDASLVVDPQAKEISTEGDASSVRFYWPFDMVLILRHRLYVGILKSAL